MTNYNDGKWHFWSGGECPVDPRSTVEIVWAFAGSTDMSNRGGDLAGNWIWLGNKHGSIFAFRVIKEHKEPREFWLFADRVYHTMEEADIARRFVGGSPSKIIHVREVLE